MATTADEGVDLFIGEALVQAVGLGTSIPSRRNPFLAAMRAFDLRI